MAEETLSPREKFKLGVLAKFASVGLTPEEMLSSVEGYLAKEAGEKQALADAITGWGIPLALAAPWAVGGLGGYALAKTQESSHDAPAEFKAQELEDEYRRNTAKLQREKMVRQFQAQQASGPSRPMY